MPLTIDQRHAIRYSPFHNLVYVKNQKVGCTSIEYSLWTDQDRKSGERTFRGSTHHHTSPILSGAGPLLKTHGEQLPSAEVFTVARNPFSRILSAYLHHIYDGSLISRMSRRVGLWRSKDIRQAVLEGLGVDPKRPLDFESFLEHLRDTPPDRLTGHFRPQVSNILLGQMHYDFIGRLEEPEPLAAFLAGHDIIFKKRAGHAQGAGRKVEHFYNDRSIQLVAEHFARDFQAFGYDPDNPSAENRSAMAEIPDGQPIFELLRESVKAFGSIE